MNVSIGVGAIDQGTAHIEEIIRQVLHDLSVRLSNEYGGHMQHLWVTLELRPSESDQRAPWSFRFQKRVVPPRSLNAFNLPAHENVGHYSVRPDYFALAEIPPAGISPYLLDLLYESTSILVPQSKRLGGFDAERFRADFLVAIQEISQRRP